MGSLLPEIRKLLVRARRNGERVKDIAKMFGVSRKTVWKWPKEFLERASLIIEIHQNGHIRRTQK